MNMITIIGKNIQKGMPKESTKKNLHIKEIILLSKKVGCDLVIISISSSLKKAKLIKLNKKIISKINKTGIA